jgi:hypothetical protein
MIRIVVREDFRRGSQSNCEEGRLNEKPIKPGGYMARAYSFV